MSHPAGERGALGESAPRDHHQLGLPQQNPAQQNPAQPSPDQQNPGGPDLSGAYETCRRICAVHGRSYYLASRLLPRERRQAVHALYAFARTVDDYVDEPAEPDASGASVIARVDRAETLVRAQLAGIAGPVHTGTSGDALLPVIAAFTDTVRRFGIEHALIDAFFTSMRMDIPGTDGFREHYASMAELREYMFGSAAAIGLQLLPVLRRQPPAHDAGSVVDVAEAARTLGEAFQLTNFIRDVGDDLDRGRVYLPADELAAFGVDADRLHWARNNRRTDIRIRAAFAHFIALTRGHYRRCAPGIAALDRRVQPSIGAAYALYSSILTEIERNDYPVLWERVTVPRARRAALTLGALSGPAKLG